MNTNTEDLLTFMVGILNNTVLSPSGTHRWLKPDSFISAFSGAVGRPWEIYRVDNLTSDSRVIDLYTKAGGLTAYSSEVILVPGYDLVVSVLVAGSEAMGSWAPLAAIKMLEVLVPAMDLAARDEAKRRFVGTYQDKHNESRVTISLDEGSGLVLSDWISRDIEVLPNLNRYTPTGTNVTGPSNITSIRMYPTGLETNHTAPWRAVFPALPNEEAEMVDKATVLRDASCATWHLTDKSIYNYLSLDYFEFYFGVDGETAVGIKSKGFDVEMFKVKA